LVVDYLDKAISIGRRNGQKWIPSSKVMLNNKAFVIIYCYAVYISKIKINKNNRFRMYYF